MRWIARCPNSTAPTANELLAMMSPTTRDTAMGVLYNLSKLKTGT